ncbi:DUF3558 domain-containing protein [Saccharomonospora sp. NB11]|uniref:DUF3558 domain-containing protein n=1 Tax=Saccharomonospora sp. NB11 TaxID=1642298 RepID=UPI0027DE20E8|nr:DUF3558 domain-containing protein [Saccharomonospora sp. NB11]
MTSRINARSMMVAGALLAFTVAGCSDKEQGHAEPKNPAGGLSSTAPTDSVPPTAIGPTLEPCELLSTDELAQVGEFSSRYEEQGGARSCHWQNSMKSGGDGFTFAVSVRDAQSVDVMNDNGAGVESIEINERPGRVSKNAAHGSCTVALKLDDISRVDISVPRTEQDDACEIAEVIAGMVEPNLPAVP